MQKFQNGSVFISYPEKYRGTASKLIQVWIDTWQWQMKIQLERNLSSDSSKLRCTVCDRSCDFDRLRTLLCRDNGSLVGDICADCLRQKTSYIQQRLRQRAFKLINQPITTDLQTPSPQKQAFELAELAHQPLTIPPFYTWWWQRIAIFTAEIRDLELARTGVSNRQIRDTKTIRVSKSPF